MPSLCVELFGSWAMLLCLGDEAGEGARFARPTAFTVLYPMVVGIIVAERPVSHVPSVLLLRSSPELPQYHI